MRGSAALTPSESETETRTPPSYAALTMNFHCAVSSRDGTIVGHLIEIERQEQTETMHSGDHFDKEGRSMVANRLIIGEFDYLCIDTADLGSQFLEQLLAGQSLEPSPHHDVSPILASPSSVLPR